MSDSHNDPLIWYPDPEHCFLLGKVLERNESREDQYDRWIRI